jgi:hypothetical protein
VDEAAPVAAARRPLPPSTMQGPGWTEAPSAGTGDASRWSAQPQSPRESAPPAPPADPGDAEADQSWAAPRRDLSRRR